MTREDIAMMNQHLLMDRMMHGYNVINPSHELKQDTVMMLDELLIRYKKIFKV